MPTDVELDLMQELRIAHVTEAELRAQIAVLEERVSAAEAAAERAHKLVEMMQALVDAHQALPIQ